MRIRRSFLNLALEEIQHAGYGIVNVDTTLVLAAPKISPIAGEMRVRVAELLGVDLDQVSIKAKTPEGWGWIMWRRHMRWCCWSGCAILKI
jgi:2-C-methyl-D-erythritol 2,4-cyclodiphosphate synthase